MPAPERETSGQVLLRIWGSYLAGWQLQFPGTRPVSMRMMSERMLADPLALARWTNDKAHQGAHPGWRVPLRRIPEVCRALEAGEDATSDLMVARLLELSPATQEGIDALVVLHWLGPRMVALSTRLELDRQQRQLVEALDRARGGVAAWEQTTGATEVSPELVQALAAWLGHAQREYLDELQAEPEPTAEERAAQGARRQTLVKRLSSSHRAHLAAAKPPTTRDTQALVRAVRKSLRGVLTAT